MKIRENQRDQINDRADHHPAGTASNRKKNSGIVSLVVDRKQEYRCRGSSREKPNKTRRTITPHALAPSACDGRAQNRVGSKARLVPPSFLLLLRGRWGRGEERRQPRWKDGGLQNKQNPSLKHHTTLAALVSGLGNFTQKKRSAVFTEKEATVNPRPAQVSPVEKVTEKDDDLYRLEICVAPSTRSTLWR
ncbi:hypothetical protein R1sor_024171 [Riccia sorocarpa]|uniref:Uncharacterized protein n=1 Tax=Riccia sorocarpa TaxID=122646 RepID=A0ABD3GSZ7_9MARC